MRSFLLMLMLASAMAAQMVWFEPNRGQVAGQTEWVGRSKGAYLYITGDEVVYANRKNVHMRLVGAAKHARVEGIEPTGGISSYFTGRGEKTWFTGIPQYAKLRYRNVYPGIDVVYYGSGDNVEYDFVVKPGGDPERIEIAFSEPVRIDGEDLVVAGLRQHRPKVMQGARKIEAKYSITPDKHVLIALGDYDHTTDLTIDPVLEFASYLGGPGADGIAQVTIDDAGYLYIAGSTQSPATPGLNPFQQSNISFTAPFLFKFDGSGTRLIYYVILASDSYSWPTAVSVGNDGTVVMLGSTRSDNFPLKNAFQSEYKAAFGNAFLSKLSDDGRALVYSTYYGGTFNESPNALRVDSQGNAYIIGETGSHDLPLKNPIQNRYGGAEDDCFVAKFSSPGTLLFSTYLGSPGLDVCKDLAIGSDGLVIAGASSSADFPLKEAIQSTVTPRTGFTTPVLVKIALDGSGIIFSTFFGGPVSGFAWAVALDKAGNIYAAGGVNDNALVTKNAFQSQPAGSNGFLVKFDSTARNLFYSTYFGGSGRTEIRRVAVDAQGSPYVTGYADSADFPVKNSLQAFRGARDCFVAKFLPAGTALVYSTLVGGTLSSSCSTLALDDKGNVYFGGATNSPDIPVNNAFQRSLGGGYDGFFGKKSDNTLVPPSPLIVSSGRLQFQFVQGDPNPQAQTVNVSGPDFSTSTSSAWLAATTVASGVSVSVNPAGLAPGSYTGSVTLSPQAGTPATIDIAFAVLAAPPVLTSIDPALVAVGSDDTAITLHGSGFTSGTTLQVNGLTWSGSPIQVINGNTIRFIFTKPNLIFETTWTITVQNPQSARSNVLTLAVGKPAPYFTAGSVTNAASYASGAVSPGEIVTIFGANLDSDVTFDLIPATLIYFSPTQVSVTVPYIIAGPTTTLRIGMVPVKLDVEPSAPGIFAVVSDPVNNIITLYATGCGPLSQDSLPRCTLPVSVTINGLDAPVLYAGIAPGLPEGANQINAHIPPGIASGPVQIVLKAGECGFR